MLATASLAQQDASATSRLHEWFDREIAQAQRIPDLSGWSLVYVQRVYPTLNQQEANALRSQIANKPDHPRLDELETYDDFARTKQPAIMHFSFYSGGEGRWRSCLSHTDAYWDTVMSPDGAWQLSAQSLEIFPADDPASSPATKRRSILIPQISRFLYGGLGIAATSNLTFTGFELLPGDKWRAIGRLADNAISPYAHVFEGTWDSARNRGFVERATVYHQGYPGPAVEHERYAGWEYSQDMERWLAHRIERFNSANRLVRTFEIESVRKNPAPLEQIIQVPRMDGRDVVRGELRVLQIADHRTKSYIKKNEDGSLTYGFITASRAAAASWWKWIGWATLAVIGVITLFVARRKLGR
ncbi:MAG: hypothetical protein IT435_16765 [Phycisphaerales bacterium]|nr:hypothetical protein [Phycisphaerales bacterium]